MLITSSQISMGISSAIVFIFSTILFLSGYVLQQQTVRDLQTVIKPLPEPTSISPDVDATAALTDTLPETSAMNWNKVGYIQLLQHPSKACSSAIIFAELHRQKSKAQRILLYPQRWLADSLSSQDRGTYPSRSTQRELEHTMRFLRKVAARYNVLLKPIEIDGGKEAFGHDRILPLNRMYALTEWQVLLYLSPSGVVYNATALDEVFALDPMSAGLHFLSADALVGAEDEEEDEDEDQVEGGQHKQEPLAALFKPSMSTYQQILLKRPGVASLASTLGATGSLAKHAAHLFRSTSTRGTTTTSASKQRDDTMSQAVMDSPAYVYFDESRIPSPDFDIPRDVWLQARPEGLAERRFWDDAYADYRAQRMGVCGLDVQALPKGKSKGGAGRRGIIDADVGKVGL